MSKFVNAAGLAVLPALVAGAWLLLPVSKLQAQSTQQTFDAKCAMCHGKDGSGNTPMGKNMKIPNLKSKAVQSKSNADLAKIITNGKGIMPKYGSQLSKKEINDMVEYIRHMSGKKKK